MSDRFGRRELLVAGGALGFGGVAAAMWTRLEPGRGQVTARAVRGGGDRILFEDGEDRHLDGVFESLGYETPGDVVVSEHLERLRDEFGTLEYRLRIDGDGGRTRFTTNVSVFDTVDLFDHVTYQVAVLERDSIRTLSCVRSTAAELETRCDFDEVDVTKRE